MGGRVGPGDRPPSLDLPPPAQRERCTSRIRPHRRLGGRVMGWQCMSDAQAPAPGAPATEPHPVHVVDAPLAPPWANSGLLEAFRRRYLLRLLVRREISARYQGSFLGLFWSYVQPATKSANWMTSSSASSWTGGIENFAIHLFAGLVMVHYFTETFGAGTRSIVRNKALVRKMAVPREMFPVASMLVSAYHVVPGMVLLTGFCLVPRLAPRPGGDGGRAPRVRAHRRARDQPRAVVQRRQCVLPRLQQRGTDPHAVHDVQRLR